MFIAFSSICTVEFVKTILEWNTLKLEKTLSESCIEM